MRRVLFVVAALAVIAWAGCGGDDGPTGGDGGPATSISEDSGDGQRIAVGATLLEPFVVVVTDAGGVGVAGVTVTWQVTAGGGSLSATTSTTGSDGTASVTLTAGSSPGSNNVTATVDGLAGSPVSFTATAVEAAAIAVSGGDGQSARISQTLAQPLEARVTAGDGGAVPGASVSWAVNAGSGSLSTASSTADSDGRASVELTLGGTAGANGVTATLDGVGSVAFNASGTAPVSVTIDMTGIAFVGPPASRPPGGGSDDARILLGDTIVWVNQDAVQHTATSTSTPQGGSIFDSGLLGQGGTFTFVPNARGTWVYFCELHPVQMADARIVVE